MNRSAALRFVSFAAGAVGLLGSATASAYDHLDAALEFITMSPAPATTNNRWGSPASIDWTTHVGVTQAPSLLTLTLKEGYDYTSTDISFMFGSISPSSDTYYTKINSSPLLGGADPVPETYFRKVASVTSILPGDIFGSKSMPADAAAVPPRPAYSAHTAIVVNAPVAITAIQPIYSGTQQWVVKIADSTTSSHGCLATYPDSRNAGACPGATYNSGAGTGYIRLYTDTTTGVIIGWTWSLTSSTNVLNYYSQTKRPFVFGRFKQLVAGPPPPPP